MLDTFIKNRGITKTIIHRKNKNVINEVNWDADYDGKHANISVDLNKNGEHDHYDVTLNNNDLANILNIKSIDNPLEKRLKNDFITSSFKCDPNIYKLELVDLPKIIPTEPEPIHIYDKEKLLNNDSIKELLHSMSEKKHTHISTPLPNEETIIPLTINGKTIDKYTLTPKKRHRKLKTHKTYKIFKKSKSISSHKRSHRSSYKHKNSFKGKKMSRRLLL